jgi:hypothetical protein
VVGRCEGCNCCICCHGYRCCHGCCFSKPAETHEIEKSLAEKLKEEKQSWFHGGLYHKNRDAITKKIQIFYFSSCTSEISTEMQWSKSR